MLIFSDAFSFYIGFDELLIYTYEFNSAVVEAKYLTSNFFFYLFSIYAILSYQCKFDVIDASLKVFVCSHFLLLSLVIFSGAFSFYIGFGELLILYI